MTDATQLRRWVYGLIIAIAFGVACGRILSVQRVYEPAFPRAWPATKPDANSMFGSNDRARWAVVRSLVHEGTYVIGKREPKLVVISAVTQFGAADPLQGAILAQAGFDLRTDVANPHSHNGIIFKEGLKEHGWATIDRVMNPATLEFHSSKPPLLSTLLAGIYWILLNLCGWSLIDHPTTVVRVMLLLVNALPFAGYLWLLAQLAERLCKSDWGKLYVVAAGAFATMVSPFLITLQNHTFAAFFVMLAWWSVLEIWRRISLLSPPGRGAGREGAVRGDLPIIERGDDVSETASPTPSPPAPLPGGEGRKAPWQLFVSAGFFASMAAASEMPALSFAVAILVLLCWWCPGRTLLFFVPAALVPAVAFFGTNYAAIGQFRPAQAAFGGAWYEYEGSHWKPPPPGYTKTGIDWAKLQESRAQYAMHLLVGHHGLFSLTPIWLFALAGMSAGCWRYRALWRQALFREASDFPWFVQPLGLTLTIVVVGFYLVESDNYGGFTNGLRWLMWLTPIWLTCLMPTADRLAQSCWGRWLGGVFLAMSVFSVSYQLWNPWRHPWIFDLMIELKWKGY